MITLSRKCYVICYPSGWKWQNPQVIFRACLKSFVHFVEEMIPGMIVWTHDRHIVLKKCWAFHKSMCHFFTWYTFRHRRGYTIPFAHVHYCDVIMGTMASQIPSLTIVYSIVHAGADQRKHQSSASLAFTQAIRRSPVNSPHKGPVTRKMFPYDDVIML